MKDKQRVVEALGDVLDNRFFDILKDEGYINDYTVDDDDGLVLVEIKYPITRIDIFGDWGCE